MENKEKNNTEETKTEGAKESIESDVGKHGVLNDAQAEEQIKVVSKEIQVTKTDMQYLKSKKQWAEIVPEELAKLLIQEGFRAPSRIQSLSVPTIKARHNSVIIAQSQNGSGKTLAFLVPSMLRINVSQPLEGKSGLAVQVLVLIHTKELCQQTHMIAKKFQPAFPNLVINMGDPKDLKKSHMLICTPGNLLNILDKRMLDLSALKVFAIDEADYVLTTDVGNNAITKVAKSMSHPEKQLLFFSATYSDKSIETIKKIKSPGQDVIEFLLPPDKLTLEGLLQLQAFPSNKIEYIESLISNLAVETQTIIFANTTSYAERLLNHLVTKDHKPGLLMGKNMSQEERELIFMKFKKGDIQILITTNLLARGVDNRSIGLVINLDMPLVFGAKPDTVDVDMYLHRIGRTGRFADVGVALNLLSRPEEKTYITTLENHYKCRIEELKDFEQLNKLLSEAKKVNELKRKDNEENL